MSVATEIGKEVVKMAAPDVMKAALTSPMGMAAATSVAVIAGPVICMAGALAGALALGGLLLKVVEGDD